MKTRFLKILIPILIIIIAVVYGLNNKLPSTAFAVGDLTINWGIGIDNVGAIFNISNMAPGQMETKTVNISNGASSSRPVAVRGIQTATDSAGLASVMDIVISENGGPDLYGGTTGTKSLAQFFTDSVDPSGIDLFTLDAEQDKDIDFKVTFISSAGNPYQGRSIVFNIIIGIGFDLPAGCEGIQFAGDPIFGTQGNDTINGGNKNQIIVSFEGNDTIRGGNGQDCILGGPGDDNLGGGNGIDVIDGGDGTDTVTGGNGDDKIFGGDGDDNLNGGNGKDQILGGAGVDNLVGGNGDDSADGQDGDDTILGGNGNDNLVGNGGTDTATGGNSTDTCIAETEISCEL